MANLDMSEKTGRTRGPHSEDHHMTAPQGGTGKAYTSEADGGGKVVAPMPFMSDICFLCGHKVGETDPRQFYTPKGGTGMTLAHTGCLSKFQANDEKWPEVEKPPSEPKVRSLGAEFQRVIYGNARVAYSSHQLTLLCDQAIAEKGIKVVIPDLIVALQTIAGTL